VSRSAGATVGHLPRDDAPRFHGILDELAIVRAPATVRARLIGGWERGPYGRGSIGVVLDVDPCASRRRLDAPFLPAELAVRVDTATRHVPILRQLLGDARSLVATAAVVMSREDGLQVMRVCIAEDEIGTLTETMTARYVALERRVLAAGFPATCAAMIEEGTRGPKVRVWLPRPDRD
jgi:hypothetical protein